MIGQAEQELREGDLVLRVIIDGTSDAIYVKDRHGRYVFVNATTARILGIPAESVAGKTDVDLFRNEEAQLMYEMDQAVLHTGQPRTFEESLVRREGVRIYHTTKTPYRGPAGEVIGIIGVSRDITQSKSQELASARLAAIVDFSADAMLGTALDGTITSWNTAAATMFGYQHEEAIDRSIQMLAPEERHGELAELHDRVLRGERIEGHETVGRRKDGSRSPIALTLAPIRDSRGTIVGASVIARDITERKRVERELRESEERQRLAVEAAALGVWYWELEARRLAWSPRCSRMHGVDPDEEVSYERFLSMLHPDDRPRAEQTIACALAECSDYRTEHRVVWPDGSVHWLSTAGCVLCNEAGAPDRMLGVVFDVTEQKRSDQERAELLRREQAARAEAQAATRAKDEFLAVLSHELRTPLQSMLGWTLMLKAPGADARMVQKGMETIERNIQLQTQLIEDLLDVSRIVAGKIRLANERFDLVPVVASALASAKAAADARSIHIDATLDPLEGDVLGDPARLEQVVSNLLSNAVKFTPSGGHIDLRLARAGTTATITVEDTGAGISPELLPHVFERFRQAESAASRSSSGLGLGLAIVHHLVDLHRGKVTAESSGEGQGATFTVTLPLVDREGGDVATMPRDSGPGSAPR